MYITLRESFFFFSQFFVRSYPLVNERVREALGDTFYEEFMVSIQWSLDLTKCQGTGPSGSLYRGFVISKTSL